MATNKDKKKKKKEEKRVGWMSVKMVKKTFLQLEQN